MAETLLQIRGLARSFYGVQALRGVDLDVTVGNLTGLIGPNGSGKTTLFNCVSGLLVPDAGKVIFAGHDVTGWRADRIARAGLVRSFQIARGFPRLSVLENLLLYGRDQPGEGVGPALLRTAAARRREAELRERAETVARRLELSAVLGHGAAELSGGQKKLLEIARALMAQPRLMLLDEPVAGVNPTLAQAIGDHLRGLVADGMTIFLIEHHMDTIARICDRVVVLADGQPLAAGNFAAIAEDERVQEAYMGRRRWVA